VAADLSLEAPSKHALRPLIPQIALKPFSASNAIFGNQANRNAPS
jgi:hypothetical protein